MAAPAKTLTRRDRNKLRNQQEILAAALTVFAEKGYRDASMQEIAERADFAVSTLYALFESKEDLYRQVSVDIGRRTGGIFEAAMARGSNAHEKLVHYARAKGEAYRESPPGVKMLEHELHAMRMEGVSSFPKNGIGRIYERFMLRIRALFEEGIAQGLFVPGDPVLMSMGLDSITNGLMLLAQSKDAAFTYDERVDEVINLFFAPVLAKPPADNAKET
ncbi:MAG: TetR family transcriptional regulator [Candidatus Hydrogenedens sp.]|nr:TetR family transcriptional regulator [Candidatus Hydrogenedens sp.]